MDRCIDGALRGMERDVSRPEHIHAKKRQDVARAIYRNTCMAIGE